MLSEVGDSLDERTGRIGVSGPFAALMTKVRLIASTDEYHSMGSIDFEPEN